MSHYYEKNIVEIKNEYTDFLINILTPIIHEGIKSIYDKAVKIEESFKKKEQMDPNFKNPGVFKIFQLCLRDIPNLNSAAIESEVNRIKERTKCSEWFDALLKSTIKSHIVLLTFNTKKKKSKIVEEKYHEKIDTNLFIHKCYIESSRIFFNYPELFWHLFTTIDIKRNQREIYDLIKSAIKEAIRKSLPMKLMLDEYLRNDYDYDDYLRSEENFKKIKKMVGSDNTYEEDLVDLSNASDDESDNESEKSDEESNYLALNKIIDSDEQEKIDNEINEIEKDIKESEKLEKDDTNLLLSHISQSVDINNLILNTSADEGDENNDGENKLENISVTKINNLENQTNENQKLVTLNGSQKKGEKTFFHQELNRYKLNKVSTPEKPPVNIVNNVNQNTNSNTNAISNINLTIKKNINNKENKNEFFNSMLN
jgi:hypothetical protein